ncbi:MAG TPA: universal stress protein [Polyangiaceae bacterium]|nr:universal stress protein [Polyangiaceae bacterium]
MTTARARPNSSGAPVARRAESKPLRDVLVATDFSPGATAAVERAAILPLSEGARVHLVHVRQGAGAAAGDRDEPAAREALRAEAERLTEIARRAGGRAPASQTYLLVGPVRREIARIARAIDADLVVLGRRGERPIGELLLGSAIDAVLQKTCAPVLVANRAAAGGYRRPLAALKLEAAEGEARIAELAIEIAGPGAEFVAAMHAYAIPFETRMTIDLASHELVGYRAAYADEAVARLRRRLASVDAPGAGLRLSARPRPAAEAILKEASDVDADLIAVGSRGRAGVSRLLLGSVAEAVVRGASCDVLVTRPDAPPPAAGLSRPRRARPGIGRAPRLS